MYSKYIDAKEGTVIDNIDEIHEEDIPNIILAATDDIEFYKKTIAELQEKVSQRAKVNNIYVALISLAVNILQDASRPVRSIARSAHREQCLACRPQEAVVTAESRHTAQKRQDLTRANTIILSYQQRIDWHFYLVTIDAFKQSKAYNGHTAEQDRDALSVRGWKEPFTRESTCYW